MNAQVQETPRHPMVIAGGIRECAERLQRLLHPSSHTVERIVELCGEMEQALVLQQLESSVAAIDARKGAIDATIRKDRCLDKSSIIRTVAQFSTPDPKTIVVKNEPHLSEVSRRSPDGHLGHQGQE